MTQTYRDLIDHIARPPLEYAPVPFWFLNEVLEPERLAWQMRQMHAQHVDAAVLHPRPGLVTEYLSPDFWRAIEACLTTAQELGMRVWLYDEYPWASGIAAGQVPDASPDYVMKNMDLLANDVVGPTTITWPYPQQGVGLSAAPLLGANEIDGQRIIDLQPLARDGRFTWQVPEGSWRVMAVIARNGLTTFDDPYGMQRWADLTNVDGVELFMRLTHEQYKARYGELFGNTIWSIFTDEPPSTFPAWGTYIPKRFREIKGYELTDILPLLWYDGGPQTARARYDYFDVVAQCYEEAFFRRTGEWCSANGLDLGGHLLLEENLILNTRFMTHAFRQLRHLQIPGVDWIFPGRFAAYVPKLAASIAHCYGRERALCETFALAGWHANMQWMRWQTQWQFVNGVDLLVPHAFFYSISDTVPIPPAPDNIGYRWYDCPPSMFYQQPYWRHYHCFADLTARSSYLLTRGTHVAEAAVFYPINSVWADFNLSDGWLRGVHANTLEVPGGWIHPDKLAEGPATVVTDSCYRAVIDGLRDHNLDVDIVDDDTLRGASAADGRLLVRDETFQVLILPAVRTIQLATLEYIAKLWRDGVTLVALRSLPQGSCEHGADDPAIAALVREIWGEDPVNNDPARRALFFDGGFEPELAGVMSTLEPALTIDTPEVYSQHRRLEDCELYYIASMRPEACRIEVRLNAIGIPELIDPQSGVLPGSPVYRYESDQTVVPLQLEPYGSICIVLRPGRAETHITATNLSTPRFVEMPGGWQVQGTQTSAGKAWAELAMHGKTEHVQDTEPFAPGELVLADEWCFEVLPEPQDTFWHADLDQLELMIPEGGVPTHMRTGSWAEQGLPGFSGIARYTQTVELGAEWEGQPCTLDLGEVGIAAQVYWNGELVGERVWAPYTFQIDTVHAGSNTLVIEVANTLANYISVRHADSKLQWAHFTPDQLASGLLSPVRLLRQRRVVLQVH
ncbi:MAG: hypothetical protein GXY52_08785 [Chloroflexi bacterium]|nr:hypothetical protein [Chloroflexota bacterium]